MKFRNTTTPSVLLLALVAVVIVTVGCIGESEPSPTPTPSTHIDKTDGSSSGGVNFGRFGISFQNRSFSEANLSTTSINLFIEFQIEGRNVDYNSVTFCAYNQTGHILQGEVLGNISVSGGQFYQTYTVEYTANTRPHYMIVDHPKLRNDTRVEATVTTLTETGYAKVNGYLNEVQTRFEWPRTNQTGKCG